MVKVKGMFITSTIRLMTLYKDAQKKVQDFVLQKTGVAWDQLEPDTWYSIDLLDSALRLYAESSITGNRTYITMGKQIYPIWKKAGFLPDNLDTVLDFIKYEAEGFKAAHLPENGEVIRQRKFLLEEDGHLIVEAPTPTYSCLLNYGVYQGIFDMMGVKGATIEQTQCIEEGGETCVFDLTWPVEQSSMTRIAKLAAN